MVQNGEMDMRRPQHLVRRGHTWFYRRVVPRPLRAIVGKTTFVKTLGTRDYGEALRRLPLVAAEAEAVLATARRKVRERPSTVLDEHGTRQAVFSWFWEQEREADAAAPPENLDEALQETEVDAGVLSRPGDPNVMAAVQQVANAIMERNHLALDKAGEDYRRLCDLVRRGMLEQSRRRRARLAGDYGAEHDPAFKGIGPHAPEPPKPQTNRLTVNDLFDRFLADPTSSRGAKANDKYRVVRRALGEFVDLDAPASTVEREHCRSVAGLLRRLPANAKKIKATRNLGPLQAAVVAERLGLPPMSPATVNSYTAKMSAVFRWAAREGLVERNVAEGLMVPVETHARDARLPFTVDQMKAVVGSDVFQEPVERWDWRQWPFLLGLFGGLRLGESCGLRTDDVQVVDGVTVVLVRPDGEGSRLKTRASQRTVPLHPSIEKAFMAFVERRRAAGQDRLFPDLERDARGYYDVAQKAINRQLRACDAVGPRQSFHSTRHNFRDALREAGAPRDVVLSVGGWAGGGGTADMYGGGLRPSTLARWVRKIKYPGLDLTHLAGSPTPSKQRRRKS